MGSDTVRNISIVRRKCVAEKSPASSLLPGQCALVWSHLLVPEEEEEQELEADGGWLAALEEISIMVTPRFYPPAAALHRIMTQVLRDHEEVEVREAAHSTLLHCLECHPPAGQQVELYLCMLSRDPPHLGQWQFNRDEPALFLREAVHNCVEASLRRREPYTTRADRPEDELGGHCLLLDWLTRLLGAQQEPDSLLRRVLFPSGPRCSARPEWLYREYGRAVAASLPESELGPLRRLLGLVAGLVDGWCEVNTADMVLSLQQQVNSAESAAWEVELLLLTPAWLPAAIRPDPSPQPSDEKSSCVFRNMEVEASISLEDSLKKEVQCSLQINLEDFEDFSSSLIRTSTPKSQTNFFKPSPVGSPESENPGSNQDPHNSQVLCDAAELTGEKDRILGWEPSWLGTPLTDTDQILLVGPGGFQVLVAARPLLAASPLLARILHDSLLHELPVVHLPTDDGLLAFRSFLTSGIAVTSTPDAVKYVVDLLEIDCSFSVEVSTSPTGTGISNEQSMTRPEITFQNFFAKTLKNDPLLLESVNEVMKILNRPIYMEEKGKIDVGEKDDHIKNDLEISTGNMSNIRDEDRLNNNFHQDTVSDEKGSILNKIELDIKIGDREQIISIDSDCSTDNSEDVAEKLIDNDERKIETVFEGEDGFADLKPKFAERKIFESFKTKPFKFEDDAPDHECEHCGKKFFTVNKLVQHIRYIHEGIQYSCHVCEKKFSSVFKLNTHQRSSMKCRKSKSNLILID